MTVDTKKKKGAAGAELEEEEEHEEEPDDEQEEEGDDAELVDAVVARVLEVLKRGDDTGGAGSDDTGGAASGAPRSARDEEQSTYAAVKTAMADLRREEASDSRIKKLEAKVERAVKEKAPAQLRRLTRIMWGSE